MSTFPQILDLRGPPNSDVDLKAQVISGLSKPIGHKSLPTVLLYDERGLRLYDHITTQASEYYLFSAEDEILRMYADQIVHSMQFQRSLEVGGATFLELGSGSVSSLSLFAFS